MADEQRKEKKVYVITTAKLSKQQKRDEQVRKEAKGKTTTKGSWF